MLTIEGRLQKINVQSFIIAEAKIIPPFSVIQFAKDPTVLRVANKTIGFSVLFLNNIFCNAQRITGRNLTNADIAKIITIRQMYDGHAVTAHGNAGFAAKETGEDITEEGMERRETPSYR